MKMSVKKYKRKEITQQTPEEAVIIAAWGGGGPADKDHMKVTERTSSPRS